MLHRQMHREVERDAPGRMLGPVPRQDSQGSGPPPTLCRWRHDWRLATVAFALFLTSFMASAADDPGKGLREIRHREIYVPYEEFLKVAGSKKDAAVMTLEEYRTLVTLAAANPGKKDDPILPPIEHALAEMTYRGVVRETVARFDATYKLFVAGEKWVRCDLGPNLPGLGRITLDDGPGWVVAKDGRAYLRTALFAERTRQHGRAADYQEEYIKRAGNKAVAGSEQTMILYQIQAGRFEQAEKNVDRLLQKNPGDFQALTLRGAACFHQNDYDQAREMLDRALQINPKHLLALIYRAEVHLSTGQKALAVRDLEAVRNVQVRSTPQITLRLARIW